MNKLTHLDCFAGIGGFSLGLEATGLIKTVAFCENNPHRVDVLNNIWPGVPIIEDIRNFPVDKYKGKIDIMTGGFPCQDISIAGKKKLKKVITGEVHEREDERRSSLWYEYVTLASKLEAKWVILENVSNLLNIGIIPILKTLNELGYDAEWNLVHARALGTPHLRKRIFIVAWKPSHFNGERFWRPLTEKEAAPRGRTGFAPCIRSWFKTMPRVLRMAYGLSKGIYSDEKERQERVASLGNAIVPQKAFLLARELLRHEGFSEEVIEKAYNEENPFYPWPICKWEDMKNFLDN